MTRIEWDKPGTRTYETGIDRCVLFISGQKGVAWPGVTGFKEVYSGMDVESRHFDGTKYATFVGHRDFEAKLSALSAPEEFAVCDGKLELGEGFYAYNQPREMFGFSYRTLIGNDIRGTDYGYKIHLIYNALAIAKSIKYSTESKNPGLTMLEWDIYTKPYRAREYVYFRSGGDQVPIVEQKVVYRPISQLIVDTTAIGPERIDILEALLYGTGTTEPELPKPAEVLQIIS